MPRRGPAPRELLLPDPVYRSVLVTQIVNKILQRGKKTTAEAIVYQAMEIVAAKTDGDALSALKRAVDNVKPQLEVKSRRVGGATYQVPVEVRPAGPTRSPSAGSSASPATAASAPWRSAPAAELLDANNGIGSSVKRKEDMHKMAESNRAYAHYRW